MTIVRTLHTDQGTQKANVIIARKLRDDDGSLLTQDDIKTLLQLRRNRLMIAELSSEIVNEQVSMQVDESINNEYIENLKAINSILRSVKESLAEI